MVGLRLLKDAPIHEGTRVILRADFDVAVQGGKILEDFRIREILPTLRYLLLHGARIRIISHLGRPHGRIVRALSMRKIARYLAGTLRKNIIFISDPFNSRFFERYNACSDILFFENVRFWPEEEENDRAFAKDLSRWGDLYVNEAFANSHRAHASMASLAEALPAYAGPRLEKETFYLNKVLKAPKRPLVAVIGGAKLETKIPVIRNFLKIGDRVLTGGVVANTILLAKGHKLGGSRVEKKWVEELKTRDLNNRKLYIPQDFVVSRGPGAKARVVKIDAIPLNEAGFDLGPATTKYFHSLLSGARTIVWNGPLGLAEIPKFSFATRRLAQNIVLQRQALKIVGGGDTIAALKKYLLLRGFDHVSTGGGAMLEFLAGKKLPGIEVLKRKV